MVCHMCGEPAVGRCDECSRYVCNDHIDDGESTRGNISCKRCTQAERNRLSAESTLERDLIDLRKCGFCGRKEPSYYDVVYKPRAPMNESARRSSANNFSYAQNQKCAVCSQYFCNKHGTIEVVENMEERRGWDL
jgi:hypothetical protein